MLDPALNAKLTLSIAAVERDTGLSKDTLRVWERRYGFPAPQRDAVGERAYTLDQVEKLRIVKRLMDAGHRPGRIVPLDLDRLQALSAQTLDTPNRQAEAAVCRADLQAHLDLIRSADITGLRDELLHLLARVGVARFVTEVLVPLHGPVGDAWIRWQMEIYQEHAYTETVQVVLHKAIATVPSPRDAQAPRVLMGTFPGEQHTMGLLMAQALLALEGCHCISLGAQTPLWDMVLAARAYRADILLLSFTACLSPNQITEGLTELRAKLPAATALWVGGSAPILHRRAQPGVLVLGSLQALPAALQAWRTPGEGLMVSLDPPT